MKKLSQTELEMELEKISTRGDCNISMDNADIENVLYNKRLVFMHTCEHDGTDAAYQATMKVITHLEKNNFIIKDIDGILIHFLSHPSYEFIKFADAIQIIHDKQNSLLSLIQESDVTLKILSDNNGHIYCKNTTEADVLFEVSHDNNVNEDYVKATIFISYYDKKLVYANNSNMPFSIN